MPILAIVPPCAGECRLVRVTGVLIFTNTRTCVLPVCCPQQARAAIAPAPAAGPAAWLGARRRAAATLIGQPAARLLLAPLPE